MRVCPLCKTERERLSVNGICRNCPELKKWYSKTDSRKSKSGRHDKSIKLSNGAVLQKPSGRSGKLVSVTEGEALRRNPEGLR